MRYDILIGIDPDTDKSGFAVKRHGHVEVATLKFFDLFDTFQALSMEIRRDAVEVLNDAQSGKDRKPISALVRISAGWLIPKSNFRQKIKKNGVWVDPPAGVRERMSEKTGRNHQVGHLIVEMCGYFGLPYEEVKPTGAKMKPELFEAITKIKTRSQEKIDAAALIL